MKIEDNIFFVNKQGDLEYSPAVNTNLNLDFEQFGNVTLASVAMGLNKPGKITSQASMFMNRYPFKGYGAQFFEAVLLRLSDQVCQPVIDERINRHNGNHHHQQVKILMFV